MSELQSTTGGQGITLVCTMIGKLFNSEEHLGIGYLAAMLRSHGFVVDVVHCNESEPDAEIAERLAAGSPLIVGFNAYAMTVRKVLLIAAALKEKAPETHICLGGPTPTFEDEVILAKCPFVDSVVRAEGELTLLELAQALAGQRPLGEIAGLSFRHQGQVIVNQDRPAIEDLDSLPRADRDLCRVQRPEYLIIETARGCLGRCSFCTASNRRFYGNRPWRGRSIQAVVEEMAEMEKMVVKEVMVI